MQLSNNFSLAALCASETATRKGIPNAPNSEQIANLTDLAATLEQVKHLVGPIHINSAFRSARLNREIGGSAHSAHLDGYAADLVAPGFGTPREVCEAIQSSGIPYDQLIAEGNWTHISCDPRLRKEVLTAHFEHGTVRYTAGLGATTESA